MQPSPTSPAASHPAIANHAVLGDVVGVREQTLWQKLLRRVAGVGTSEGLAEAGD